MRNNKSGPAIPAIRGSEQQFQEIVTKLHLNYQNYFHNKDYRLYSDQAENIFYTHRTWSKEEFYKELEARSKLVKLT